MNFVGSFAWWLHGNSIYTGYIPFLRNVSSTLSF
jgi:hypothetical protein